MKKLLSVMVILTVASARALVFDINLNATNDPAGILSGIYETTPNASTATGGEVGTGITYDTDTRGLSINVAYGLFGFQPLTGTFSAAHIHGPAGQGTNAPVLIGLFAGATDILTEITPNSGFFAGTVTLTPQQEDMLFANLLYLNVHSTPTFGAGEIRGQLIPSSVPEPSSLILAGAGLALLLVLRRKRA